MGNFRNLVVSIVLEKILKSFPKPKVSEDKIKTETKLFGGVSVAVYWKMIIAI